MILFGKPVAEKIYTEIKKEMYEKKLKPFLAVILVGENSASISYINAKERVAKELSIGFRLYHFPEIAREEEVLKLINDLNRNDYISGIVVQLPLPEKMSIANIINKISPEKDVDGFLGKYPTPAASAILEILNYYKIELENKNIVIIGRGRLVGAPLEKLLIEKNIKTKICDKKTSNLGEVTRSADIIISATGASDLITSEMVNSDTIVIDAGIAESSGKICGDLAKNARNKVASYSPVPGGVGPVTVACLMKNLVQATKK